MKGLSIRTGNEAINSRVKCQFGELLDPIQELVADLYWIVDEVILCGFPPYGTTEAAQLERVYEAYLLTQTRDLKLMRPGFIQRFAPYITGDWDKIVGVESEATFADGAPLDVDRIALIGRVYFQCIDAAYWDVYCADEQLLQRLADRFPASNAILLEESWY